MNRNYKNTNNKTTDQSSDGKALSNLAFLTTLSCICMLVAACGGGGGGGSISGGGDTGGGDTGGSTPTYELLNSTAEATSVFGGVGLRNNSSTGAFDTKFSSGELRHDTGALSLSDGSYDFADSDGANSSSVWRDANGATLSEDTAFNTAEYGYLATYNLSYVDTAGVRSDTLLVGGIATAAADMPTAGSGSYQGAANASLATATMGYSLQNGNSVISADFQNQIVDVTLNNFTVTNQANGQSAVAPMDTIKITAMDIGGNQFTGGTLTTELSGASVDVTGGNTTTAASGQFFGYDSSASTAIPDEVGGVFTSKGDDGLLVGGFIGD